MPITDFLERNAKIYPNDVSLVEINPGTFDVYVELRPERFDNTVKNITALEKSLANAMRNMIGIGPSVHPVPSKTIQRSVGKAKRVIDERKLH